MLVYKYSSKSFLHLENYIRQATENIIIKVNERAWQKMEAILDEEFKMQSIRIDKVKSTKVVDEKIV